MREKESLTNGYNVVYFTEQYREEILDGSAVVVQSAGRMTSVYIIFKIFVMMNHVKDVVEVLRRILSKQLEYGIRASPEDVLEAGTGNECSICQDRFSNPIKLPCDHIFCEDCVAEWLERENTCPLCRAVVPSAGIMRYSDGSAAMLPQIL